MNATAAPFEQYMPRPSRHSANMRVVGRELDARKARPRLRRPMDRADLVAILQIPADAFEDRHRFDAIGAQDLGWAHAGQHKQLRRVEGACAQDDLAARLGLAAFSSRRRWFGARAIEITALEVFDASRALVLEYDARGERVIFDLERIFSGGDHALNPLARAAPAALLRRHRRLREAYPFVAVEADVVGVAFAQDNSDPAVDQPCAAMNEPSDERRGIAEKVGDAPRCG